MDDDHLSYIFKKSWVTGESSLITGKKRAMGVVSFFFFFFSPVTGLLEPSVMGHNRWLDGWDFTRPWDIALCFTVGKARG